MTGIGHNRSFLGTENPADTGFLIGDYRPTPDLHGRPAKGDYAAKAAVPTLLLHAAML